MKKTNVFKTLAVAVMLIFTAQSASAQLEQSVYLNFTAPTAQYGKKLPATFTNVPFGKENIAMQTTPGFGMGYRVGFTFDIGYGDVTPFLNADLLWNRTASEYRDSLAKDGCKIPNYLNLPMTIGVNYRYGITDIISAFGEFGIGYDAFFITPEGKKGTGSAYYNKYKAGGALTWQIGAGAYFGNHFSVGIHYVGLGKHTINYNYSKTTPSQAEQPNDLRSLGDVALRIGFHF